MLSFQELIAQRQSIRHYTSESLSEEQVVTIVEAGLRAPSSRSLRPWQFIVVDAPHLLHQLSECKPIGSTFVEHAAVAIVFVAEPYTSDTWVEDCSVAHTFMWLQAEALGLGACWVQLHQRTQTDGTPCADFVADILNIPAGLQAHSILSIGHATHKHHKPISQGELAWEKVHFNGMQNEAHETYQDLDIH